jgi:hypothetical protein
MTHYAVTSTDLTGVPAPWVPHASDEFLHRRDGDPGMPWKETWFVGADEMAHGFALSLHMTVSPERADGVMARSSPSTPTAVTCTWRM